MCKFIYKLLLTLNSIGLLLVVYFVRDKMWIKWLGNLSVILYALILLALTAICLWLKKFLSYDAIEGGILNIEMANDAYLPSYLGYFFVALSIPAQDMLVLTFVFVTLFFFVFFSQTLYYNPLFRLFGYKFYYVTSANAIKVFIISRQEIRATQDVSFRKLRRINNFTFIDEEKDR